MPSASGQGAGADRGPRGRDGQTELLRHGRCLQYGAETTTRRWRWASCRCCRQCARPDPKPISSPMASLPPPDPRRCGSAAPRDPRRRGDARNRCHHGDTPMTHLADLTAAEASRRIKAGERRARHCRRLYRAGCGARGGRPGVGSSRSRVRPCTGPRRRRASARWPLGRPARRHSGRPQGRYQYGRYADAERLRAFAGHQPERDAGCVAQLRAAGAVLMGKTVTTELATTCRTRRAIRTTSSTRRAVRRLARRRSLADGADGARHATGGSVIRPASLRIYGNQADAGPYLAHRRHHAVAHA